MPFHEHQRHFRLQTSRDRFREAIVFVDKDNPEFEIYVTCLLKHQTRWSSTTLIITFNSIKQNKTKHECICKVFNGDVFGNLFFFSFNRFHKQFGLKITFLKPNLKIPLLRTSTTIWYAPIWRTYFSKQRLLNEPNVLALLKKKKISLFLLTSKKNGSPSNNMKLRRNISKTIFESLSSNTFDSKRSRKQKYDTLLNDPFYQHQTQCSLCY